MKRRWLPLAAAAVLAAGLAAGTGYVVDRSFQPQPEEPVQLKSVPATVLSRVGVTAEAARTPAYCNVVGIATEHGIGGAGAAGCPISRQAAEAAARQGGSGRTTEAVLARVTARQPTIGTQRLVWLVVLQNAISGQPVPAVACPIKTAQGTAATAPCGGFTGLSQLVFVDAHTATVLLATSVGIPPARVAVPAASAAGASSQRVVPVPIRGGPAKVQAPLP